MPKIVHFRDKCIGCNSCVEHAPEHWEMSQEDGKSNLKKSDKRKETHIRKISIVEVEANKKAAEDCPVKIIQVID
jgi:ferredoxin